MTEEKSEEDKDFLDIPCPKCPQKHRFLLDVDRSFVMYLASVYDEKPVTKRFTRIFTCPITDENFQVTFSVIQNYGTIINGVKVKGVADGREEGKDSNEE